MDTQQPAITVQLSSKQVASNNINTAMTDIQNMWKLPNSHIQAVQKVVAIRNTRHGLFSGVPIICKGADCAYAATCMVDPADRVVGGRCPQEIAALLTRFEELCKEFGITEEDAVDMGQLKELVDLEIMMLRCDNKMAYSADIITRSVKDIAKNGRVLYEDKIDPVAEFKLNLIEKHSKILKDLNGTRDAKKGGGAILDPSQTASDLIRKAKEIEEKLGSMAIEVVESTFTEVTDDDIANLYGDLTPMNKPQEHEQEGGE